MEHYAPNPDTSSEDGNFAALTSGLLARKGEAMPAVDATAHEGVDIDLYSGGAALKQAPHHRDNNAASRRDTSNVRYFSAGSSRPAAREGAVAPSQAPSAWKIVTPQNAVAREVLNTLKSKASPAPSGPMASVKFKINAREFVRLQLAARTLEISSRQVLIEALQCYLEANDIIEVSDAEYANEMRRLKNVVRRRRKARPGKR